MAVTRAPDAMVDVAVPAGRFAHETVLLREAVQALVTRADGVYLDGTFGRGGHARAVLAQLGSAGRLLAIDRDLEAVEAAHTLAAQDARFSIHHSAFAAMAAAAAAANALSLDGVLLDLGVSSPQIDNPQRGFSFRFDGPLDMRMDTSRGESAADFLARADAGQIAQVVKAYGEERFAVSVAKAIVARREGGHPVRTTHELSSVVAGAVKTREFGQNPATRTFQALRIFVNGELDELGQGLDAALSLLKVGGRLVVISFHSLEDRIVKTFIARHSQAVFDRRVPFAAPAPCLLRSLGRVRPSDAEVQGNGRARSAVMRVAERTEALA
jgi:16S rRNA (cytosine1402-N4)-methyltransferase